MNGNTRVCRMLNVDVAWTVRRWICFASLPLLALVLSFAGCVTPQFETETVYQWHTLAGQPGGLGNVDGFGAAARFCQPCGVACDGAGNVYVADYYNYALRKISPDGAVTTFAGSVGDAGNNDGIGNGARFDKPSGVAVDTAGNVYVADTWNRSVRKVAPSGAVNTLTNGVSDFLSPRGLAVNVVGHLIVSDNERQTISCLTPKGVATLLAGSASRHGSVDGCGNAACFSRPCGIAVNALGRLTVTDNFNHTVRTVTPEGVVTTLVGRALSSGSLDGTGAVARLSWPSGMAQDDKGNVYWADSGNHPIRKVSPDGVATTLAGSAGNSGAVDASGSKARFAWPADVARDDDGNLYVADRGNQTIRKVTAQGAVTTLAGAAGKTGRMDGVGGAARFNNPSGVAVDDVGNVYVADTGNHTIRKIMPGGEVTTLAGCAGMRGGVDGRGMLARFNGPSDVALDDNGFLYVTDACNNRIVVGVPTNVEKRTVPPSFARRCESGQASAPAVIPCEAFAWEVFAGQPGTHGIDDGKGRRARLGGPQGVAIDDRGRLYVADGRDNTIRMITQDGVVSTIRGKPGSFAALVGIAVDTAANCYVTDSAHGLWKVSPSEDVKRMGDPSSKFGFAAGVAVDERGNVYVADYNACTIRKVTPAGEVSLLAGCAGQDGNVDGIGGRARFARPSALAMGREGILFVAAGNRIRKVNAQGEVTTLASSASFGRLDGLAVDGKGNIYAADRELHAIWKVSRKGVITKVGGSEQAMGGSGWLVTGLAVDRAGNVYVSDFTRNCVIKGTPQK